MGVQATKREGERSGRRVIEPLDVVDRDEQRLISGQNVERIANRDPERARIEPVVMHALAEQRRSEAPSPWWRQPRQHSISIALQKVTEANDCQGQLGLRRARNEDANSTGT